MDVRMEQGWHDAIAELIIGAQLCQPDELSAVVNRVTSPLGVDVTVFLVDLEQRELRPLPERGKPLPDALTVEGTLAGRVFTEIRAMPSPASGTDPGRIWVPLVDGTERLGVIEVRLREDRDPFEDGLREQCEIFAGLLGHLIASKLPYGDLLHQVRRTRPATPASELVMKLLPPLTFTCDRMVITATLEPSYEVGGDAFDYAVDESFARLMILDAMGRGMYASLTCAAALSATRSARRDYGDLYAMARAADQVLLEQFTGTRFVTGLLAELDLDTGLLRYLNAGHPPALVLRRGKLVHLLEGGRRLPLGLHDASIQVAEEQLEPGDDLLFYTDGITEAHPPGGEQFGLERLVDLAERHALEEIPAPEKLRRLSQSVITHQNGPPTDDATLMLLEWSAAAAHRAASITVTKEGRT
jgi:sigma-B regulation protein RsbU (phosphoserine phosphatase)